MLARRSRLGTVLGLSLITAAAAAACGGGKTISFTGGGGNNGTGNNGTGNSGSGGDGITLHGSDGGMCGGFTVTPTGVKTITVVAGQTTPTVTFEAMLNCGAASPGWSVDKGNIGTVPTAAAPSAVFTPSGTTGGLATITASLNGKTATGQVLVKLTASQNGPNGSPGETAQIPTGTGDLTSGGGVGGVGGEGLGTIVTDPATLTALGAPTSNGIAHGLAFLYPYNKTVWPRGILAPLLMWTWVPPGGAAPGDADAIKIDLTTTSGSFTYSGTFGRPTILKTTGGNFIRMPIPEDVWAMATNTAGGKADQLTLSLTVAKGGVGYGPISETWTIASALLDGTIYYNSYGTQLAHNYCCDITQTNLFGGAVLSIHVGDTAPKLVAGGTLPPPESDPNTTAGDACRVCHSVAAGGSVLVVQNDNNRSWGDAYTLSVSGDTETPFAGGPSNPVADSTYSAIYPDGSKTLTRSGTILTVPGGTLAAVQPTGLPGNPYMPAFSPDGTLLAFNSGVGPQLTVMSFASKTGAFTNAITVVDDTSNAGLTPAWPGFFPDSKSVVFHQQSNPGYDSAGAEPCTRGGALAQIAWTNLAGAASVTPLDNLNGKGYLPKLSAPSTLPCVADGVAVGAGSPYPSISMDLDHSDDVDHNYEPTVNPIGSGGYAWVVFTSRRMYGTVAAIPPFCSDPRGVDLINNITPKKLWVAAVDLTQAPGTDSSHPAFYLPGQELLAGNSRGFWVLDPCLADGATCTSGDQCCNGYCEPGDGGLVCSNMTPGNTCSAVGDKCTTAANCCDTTNVCLNGFCAVNAPQ